MSTAATAVNTEFVRRRNKKNVENQQERVVKWRDGFHPPSGVTPEEGKAALDALISRGLEPSPDNLLEATKSKKHHYHREIWGEDDATWAHRGRRERCRQLIDNVVEIVVVGGKRVETRVVEYVRMGHDEGRWANMAQIMADRGLRAGYVAGIESLNIQAAAKAARWRQLEAEEGD